MSGISVVLKNGQTLMAGDVFRLKLSGEPGDGSTWSYFRFRGFTRNGDVTCYGGDDDPNGRRSWHSFTPERVRTQGSLVRTSAEEDARLERRRARKAA